MRLQRPDQLSTVLIWVSAIFMALKAGIENWPAAAQSLPVLNSAWLNFAPLALLAFAALRSIKRSSSGNLAPLFSEGEAVGFSQGLHPNDLPESTTNEYLELIASNATEIKLRGFLTPYIGKWVQFSASMWAMSARGSEIQAQLYHDRDGKRGAFIGFAYFAKKWENHLQNVKDGDQFRFRGKVRILAHGKPDFIECIPI